MIGWIVAGALLWLAVAISVGIIVGRAIRLADEMEQRR